MAEYVATQRTCAGVLLLSGALPLAVLGSTGWPAGVPAQIHYTAADPFGSQEWLDALASDIRTAGGPVEIFDYPGTGHLFTDPSLPAEYDQQATSLLWNAPWHSVAHRTATPIEKRRPLVRRREPPSVPRGQRSGAPASPVVSPAWT